jgi:hypothetical protein
MTAAPARRQDERLERLAGTGAEAQAILADLVALTREALDALEQGDADLLTETVVTYDTLMARLAPLFADLAAAHRHAPSAAAAILQPVLRAAQEAQDIRALLARRAGEHRDRIAAALERLESPDRVANAYGDSLAGRPHLSLVR